MTVYKPLNDTVEVVKDATTSDYSDMVEKYRQKEGAYIVRDNVRWNGTVEVLRLEEVAADD